MSDSEACRPTYQAILGLSREEIRGALEAPDSLTRATALISAALHDEDLNWVQGRCIEFLRGPDPSLRATALVALAHLARLHGRLDYDRLREPLAEAEQQPDLAGVLDDFRDDVEMFIERRQDLPRGSWAAGQCSFGE